MSNPASSYFDTGRSTHRPRHNQKVKWRFWDSYWAKDGKQYKLYIRLLLVALPIQYTSNQNCLNVSAVVNASDALIMLFWCWTSDRAAHTSSFLDVLLCYHSVRTFRCACRHLLCRSVWSITLHFAITKIKGKGINCTTNLPYAYIPPFNPCVVFMFCYSPNVRGSDGPTTLLGF